MMDQRRSGLSASDVRHGAPVAVVDIGSNSVRLVVYETAGRAPIPVFNERAICGLGRGLGCGAGQSERLSYTAVEHAQTTLERFAVLCNAMGVTEVHAIATAAIRDAEDGAAFVREAELRSGLKIRVLSGVEEARISASGVLSAFPAADGIMADLGGGSVELVELDGGSIRAHETVPLGPLRLGGKQNAVTAANSTDIVEGIGRIGWLGQTQGKKFYAVGGAWRALAQIHMTQRDYPLRVVHGYEISATEAREFMAVIAGLGRPTLQRIPGIDRRRIDVLPYAATLLSHLLVATRASGIVFSAFGVREGCIYEQLSNDERGADPLIEACRRIAARDGRAPNDGNTVYHWMSPLFSEETGEQKRLREAASLLADIAWSEHSDHRVEHAFLRVLRLPIVGIDHPGRTSIAIAVAARHAAVDKTLVERHVHGMIDEAAIVRARTIGLALRLGYTLCGGVTSVLEETIFRCDAKTLTLALPRKHASLASDVVVRRFVSLAKLMGRKAVLERGDDVAG
jgi:exopolyphosphatase/guanosine-5'-triphosphate,3'-diphosphate pyrophosphatase